MPLQYQIGQAFKWPPRAEACALSDLIRIHDEAGTLMIALANAGSDGWSTRWPTGSRLLLDLVVDAWRATPGPIDTRAPVVIGEVRKRFPALAGALVPPEPDDLVGLPSGTLLVASMEATTCRFDWIGADSGLLIRGAAVASQTTPHTIQELLRAAGVSEEDMAKSPSVITRSIMEGHEPDLEASSLVLPSSLQDGDWILLVNHALCRAMPRDELVRQACAHDSPQRLADELVGLAFAHENISYAAAVAVRCQLR